MTDVETRDIESLLRRTYVAREELVPQPYVGISLVRSDRRLSSARRGALLPLAAALVVLIPVTIGVVVDRTSTSPTQSGHPMLGVYRVGVIPSGFHIVDGPSTQVIASKVPIEMTESKLLLRDGSGVEVDLLVRTSRPKGPNVHVGGPLSFDRFNQSINGVPAFETAAVSDTGGSYRQLEFTIDGRSSVSIFSYGPSFDETARGMHQLAEGLSIPGFRPNIQTFGEPAHPQKLMSRATAGFNSFPLADGISVTNFEYDRVDDQIRLLIAGSPSELPHRGVIRVVEMKPSAGTTISHDYLAPADLLQKPATIKFIAGLGNQIAVDGPHPNLQFDAESRVWSDPIINPV